MVTWLVILDCILVNCVFKPLIATIGKALLGTVKPLLNVADALTINCLLNEPGDPINVTSL